ncbi:MAG: monofunctional biosynthetic peptidoglycan transglycosylase [Saprospiraceae bacterium]
MEVQPKVQANKFNWFRWYRLFAYVVLFGFTSTILVTLLYRIIPIPVTPLMVIRLFEQALDEKRELRLYKDWESLSNISPNISLAVVCSEDQNFPNHKGFDFEAIEKAIEHNQKYRRKRGASTISQQTAKNVFLWPKRSWLRKGLEVYFTVLIESFWSKSRILEVYINIVEMSDGVYGMPAASYYYFKKEAKEINASQAAALAVTLPSPLRYKANRLGSYLTGRRDWVMKQMKHWDYQLQLD